MPKPPNGHEDQVTTERVVMPRHRANELLNDLLAARMLLRPARMLQHSRGDSAPLTVADDALQQAETIVRHSLARAATSPAVMVVDDEPEARDATCYALQRAGFTTIAAPNGLSALQTLQRETVDAVLLDLHMPGLTGWDLLPEIRVVSSLPIVVLTAWGPRQADLLRAFTLGADDFVRKPYSPAELVARLNAVLRRESGGVEFTLPGGYPRARIAVCQSQDLSRYLMARPAYADLSIDTFDTIADFLAARSDTFDLVVVGGGGDPDLGRLERFVRRHPSTTVLAVGNSDDFTHLDPDHPDQVALLGTPFRIPDLWSMIDDLLTDPSPGGSAA